jgi:hypothetical protein
MRVTSTSLNRIQAQQFRVLRIGLIGQLYPTELTSTVGSPNDNQSQTLLLSDLLSSFKRFAGNQQTTYDYRPADEQQNTYENGAGQPSATTTANRLARQVDTAIAQVFRKAPGRVAPNFIDALDAAFPNPSKGHLGTLPARSQTLLNNPNGKSLDELSTRQLGLYRQTSVLATDALKLLDELQTFVSEADKERFEALRSLIQSQIMSLVEEFGRADEPRSGKVLSTLRSLQEYVVELGEQGRFNDPFLAATIGDDDQIAKFDVLTNYIKLMSRSWAEYHSAEKSGRVYSISERADRTRVLLPIVSQANQDLGNALESVGLSATERRSRACLFTTLQSPAVQVEVFQPRGSVEFEVPQPQTLAENQISAWLPDITISDLQDWLHRYSTMEAPSALTSVYGIDFVTDQADRLFWTIAPVVGYLKTTRSLNPSGQTTLAQILSNERVSLAFDNLLSQLNALADLAV